MSGLEMEEFSRRMAALTDEEQIVVAKHIKDEFLFKEIEHRSIVRRLIIKVMGELSKLQGETRWVKWLSSRFGLDLGAELWRRLFFIIAAAIICNVMGGKK